MEIIKLKVPTCRARDTRIFLVSLPRFSVVIPDRTRLGVAVRWAEVPRWTRDTGGAALRALPTFSAVLREK